MLGRGWSHDYAERLVSNSTASEVLLITRYAAFRKYDFRNPSGVYDRVSPGDETRKLKKTSTGWELRDLDGTVQVFDSSGLWVLARDSPPESLRVSTKPLPSVSCARGAVGR